MFGIVHSRTLSINKPNQYLDQELMGNTEMMQKMELVIHGMTVSLIKKLFLMVLSAVSF